MRELSFAIHKVFLHGEHFILDLQKLLQNQPDFATASTLEGVLL
jgi:hypothetical protein